MDSLTELLCDVDDFCRVFLPLWRKLRLSAGKIQWQRERSLSVSEIMTTLIHFHQSYYRDCKASYTDYVLEHLQRKFPDLVSYTRFVAFIPSVLIPLCVYWRKYCFGTCTEILIYRCYFVSNVQNLRIHTHKVFAGLAERGKTSTGWFLGFKLRLNLNDRGELLNLLLIPDNVDDPNHCHRPSPAHIAFIQHSHRDVTWCSY